MTDTTIPVPLSALRLLREVPYVFTQDELLNVEQFADWANKWGVDLTSSDVLDLVAHKLLAPLFALTTDSDPRNKIELEWGPYVRFAEWAREGLLRDGSDAWTDVAVEDLLFSQWQAFDLKAARSARNYLDLDEPEDRAGHALNRRRVAMTISALTPRHLPAITGQIVFPHHVNQDGFYRAEDDVADIPRLAAAGAKSHELREWAEYLLGTAKDDPAYKWWPIMRYSNHAGWDGLRGETALAVWKRVGAEVLLRAHEHLAEERVVEPLPDVSGARFWTALMDRVTPRQEDAPTLDNALNALGVAPQPRVTLIIEGATEEIHLRQLLMEVGANGSSRVRLFKANGTRVSPHLLARWVSAPRIAGFRGDYAVVDGPPTATMIALDPEGFFKDGEQRRKTLQALKRAIREDVEAQGALISDDELGILVDLRVWSERCYELENFSDAELIDAISTIREEQGRVADDTWRGELAGHLAWVRKDRLDIGAALGKAGVGEPKRRLAELLLPTLLDKLAREIRNPTTPVIRLALDVRKRMAQLSNGGYVLRRFPND